MEDELYEIFINNLKEKLQERVLGEVSVTKDDRNIYIGIYRFGFEWRTKIFNVDFMDPEHLDSSKWAEVILFNYREFLRQRYFKM